MAVTIRRAAAVDFYHFWLMGAVVRAGEAQNVYTPAARIEIGERAYQRAVRSGAGPALRRAATKFRRLETTATPFLYATFFPFVTGHYERDRTVFNALGLLVFVLALAAVAWRLGYGTTGTLVLVGLVLLVFEPLRSDVRVGNVNRLQFGALVLYAWLLWTTTAGDRVRPALAGGWLGIAALWKPNLVFVIGTVSFVWWVRGERARPWSHLAGVAAGALAAAAYAIAFFGTARVWLWWLQAAARLTHDFPVPVGEGNFAPTRVLEQGFGVRLGVAWPIALVALLGLALRRTASSRRGSAPVDGEILVLVGIGCAVSLLAAPLAWLHYYLLGVFLVAWVLRPAPRGGAVPWPYRVAGVGAVVALSMGPLLQLFVPSAPYRWAAFGNGGLLVLLLLGLYDLGRLEFGPPIRDASVCPSTNRSSLPTKPGSSSPSATARSTPWPRSPKGRGSTWPRSAPPSRV